MPLELTPEEIEYIRQQALKREARKRRNKGLPPITAARRGAKRAWNETYRQRVKLGIVDVGRPGAKKKESTP